MNELVTRPKLVDKVWGMEEIFANNDKYCGKLLHIHGGYRCSIHYHREKDETFYVLKGMIKMEALNQDFLMYAGDSIRIHKGVKHRFTGIEASTIIEVSTTDKPEDSYRETQSERVSE